MPNWACKALRREGGFTLVELLVLIVILGILIAIAIPTFLGQQNSAHDAAVQVSLATTAHDAKADWTSGGQKVPADLESQIAYSEPQNTYETGSDCKKGVVDVQLVGSNEADYRELSDSGWCFLYKQKFDGVDQRLKSDTSGTTTNLITDPSAEDSSGISNDPGHLDSWQTIVGHGGNALTQVPAAGAGVSGNHAFNLVEQDVSGTAILSPEAPVTTGASYTASFSLLDVSASATVEYRLLFANGPDAFPTVYPAWSTATAADAGTRLSTSATATANYALLEIEILNGPVNSTVEFDAVQLEQGTTASTYFDGSLSPAQWTGTPHRSASTETGYTDWVGW